MQEPCETTVTGSRGRLHARVWPAATRRRRGVVVVVHGLGEHSGNYVELAQWLAAAGWSCLAFDQQGHGLSPGRRGCIASYDSLLDDLDAACRTARDLLGGGPLVLVGHSMGGSLAVNYLLRRDPAVDALVLSGPFFVPKYPPRRDQIWAARLAGQLLPWIRIRAPIAMDQLTHDPQMRSALEADPLRHLQLSLYLVTQLLAQGRWALDNAWRLQLPTLVLQGQDDWIADAGASEAFALRVGGNARFQSYPGMLHEVFHERDRDQVFAAVIRWLEQIFDGPIGDR